MTNRDVERKYSADLLEVVFTRAIDVRQLFDRSAEILGIPEGSPYPKFVWKASHYLTDKDICDSDPSYEQWMREDIWESYKQYFKA